MDEISQYHRHGYLALPCQHQIASSRPRLRIRSPLLRRESGAAPPSTDRNDVRAWRSNSSLVGPRGQRLLAASRIWLRARILRPVSSAPQPQPASHPRPWGVPDEIEGVPENRVRGLWVRAIWRGQPSARAARRSALTVRVLLSPVSVVRGYRPLRAYCEVRARLAAGKFAQPIRHTGGVRAWRSSFLPRRSTWSAAAGRFAHM
jgi:hypothetical protein